MRLNKLILAESTAAAAATTAATATAAAEATATAAAAAVEANVIERRYRWSRQRRSC